MLVCDKCGKQYPDTFDGSFCPNDGNKLVHSNSSSANSGSSSKQQVSKVIGSSTPDYNHRVESKCRIEEGLFKNQFVHCDDTGLYLAESYRDGARVNRKNVAAWRLLEEESKDEGAYYRVLIKWNGDGAPPFVSDETSVALLDEHRLTVLKDTIEERSGILEANIKAEDLLNTCLVICLLFVCLLSMANGFLFFLVSVIAVFALYFALGNLYKRSIEQRFFTSEERRNRTQKRQEHAAEMERIRNNQIAAEKEREEKRREEQKRQLAKNLKCPMCGSHDVERISGRAILASTALKQAGKQYRCNFCKHMW